MFDKFKRLYQREVKFNQKQFINMINGRFLFLRNYTIEKQKREFFEYIKKEMPENPMLHGYKVYSQNDEDGIINFIFSKIPHQNSFIELGCGNGLENNTHWLLLNGWKGVWVDGSEQNYQFISEQLGGNKFPCKLLVDKQFITLQNANELCKDYLEFLETDHPDFFSLDIDGNDFYIAEDLLKSGVRPKVFCIEYNCKFPPPAVLNIAYDEKHIWEFDDYQSASLQCWVNMMQSFDYTLVCCNASGANAFFIHNNFVGSFTVYSVKELFQPARFHFAEEITGHFSSFGYLKNLLDDSK